eukprot:UN14500
MIQIWCDISCVVCSHMSNDSTTCIQNCYCIFDSVFYGARSKLKNSKSSVQGEIPIGIFRSKR